MKKLLSMIMLFSLTGLLCAMEDQWEKEKKDQSENSAIMTEATWDFLKKLPVDLVPSIISYLPLKERLHVLAGLLFEIKRNKKHLLFDQGELIKSLLKADDNESFEMGREILKLMDNTSSFQQAEQTGNDRKIIDLIYNGAKVNVQDQDGCTLLHRAIKKRVFGHLLIDSLLASGASVTLKDNVGNTPLIYAAIDCAHSCPDLKLIKTLIEMGADPTVIASSNLAVFNGKTPLQIVNCIYNNPPHFTTRVELDLEEMIIELLKQAEEVWKQKAANKKGQ